jgi:DNA-binding NarL/FixJ family response regulator
MHSDKRFITQAFEAGSDGYLLKESAFEELALAIKTVMAGRRYLGKQISEMLANEYLNGQKNNKLTGPAALSPREREVLQQLAEGKSTKQVAFNLGLSVKTVETYRQKIMEKTGIETIAGLTKYAIKEGLTGL